MDLTPCNFDKFDQIAQITVDTWWYNGDVAFSYTDRNAHNRTEQE